MDREALEKRAKGYADAKQWDAAIEAYGAILALDGNDFVALSSRGTARSSAGDAAGAVEDLNRALELRPDAINTRFNRGFALTKLGRFQEALADFEAYLAKDPEDADSKHQRARCKAELGEVEERDGRLAAAPRQEARVPPHLRVRQGFGFGIPTFAITLIVGGIFAIVRLADGEKKVDPAFLAGLAGGAVLGVLILLLNLRARRRAISLVPTVRGVAVYRFGEFVSELQRDSIGSYAHSVLNTVYMVFVCGTVIAVAVAVGQTEPQVFVLLLPVILVLASDVRSRLAFTHLFVLRGERVAMFPKSAFERGFGNVRRWAL